MASKTEKDKAKQLQDKCQAVLTDLLRDEDNKYCVDCDSKGPRWASWNLGVFLCIRCAGIHRNLGVHISKVKSVNLDSWTPEQVVSLQQMGNSRARAVYEANIPDNFRRPQNDTSLETFIRAKYEHKKYIAKEWVPPPLPKVNWEKEIEEEMERQKRKKKSLVEKKSLGNVEVPQLPKPKNPSPKPVRAVTAINEDKQVTDLLALQNGEDGFSNFLSAPVKEETKKDEDSKEKDSAKSEEESFFNQPAPTEKEKAKMTKDSILALYGNTPPINNFNPAFAAPIAQMPYGNFSTAQQNFQNYNFPTTQQPFPVVQNGGGQQFQPVANQFASSFPGQFNQFGSAQAIQIPPGHHQYQYQSQQHQPQQLQHQSQQLQHQSQQLQHQPQHLQHQSQQLQHQPQQLQHQPQQLQHQHQQPQFPSNPAVQFQTVPNQYNSLLYQPQSFGTKPPVANPFFGGQTGLQQQFSNLSLTGQQSTNTAPPPTLATNIWQ